MCRGHQAAARQALQPEMGSNVGSHSCLFQHLTEAVFMSPGSQTSIEAGALHLKLRGSHCFPTKFSPLPDHPQGPKHSTGRFSCILCYLTDRWEHNSLVKTIILSKNFQALFHS